MITDILIHPGSLDAVLVNGKLVTGECTAQNQWLLLASEPYAFGQSPFACVGATGYLDDDGEVAGDLPVDISKKFRIDGMTIRSININNGKVKIDATYE